MKSDTIYVTGFTPQGLPLIGGVWKLYHQNGFPIEMSHVVCETSGLKVDWLEAMADASATNNLPSLWSQMVFLPQRVLAEIASKFCLLTQDKTHEQILKEKRNETLSPNLHH